MQETEQAKDTYDDALASGHGAALLTQVGREASTLSVSRPALGGAGSYHPPPPSLFPSLMLPPYHLPFSPLLRDSRPPHPLPFLLPLQDQSMKDVFSVRVGNLPPGSQATITLTYATQVGQPAERERGRMGSSSRVSRMSTASSLYGPWYYHYRRPPHSHSSALGPAPCLFACLPDLSSTLVSLSAGA